MKPTIYGQILNRELVKHQAPPVYNFIVLEHLI